MTDDIDATMMEGTVVSEDDATTQAAEAAADVGTVHGDEEQEEAAADENPFALGDDEAAANGEAEEGDDDVFELEAPDGMQVAEEYKEIYAAKAKEAGLPGGKAAAYIRAVLEAERDAAAARLDAQEADLRKEWGAKFNDNVTAAKAFARQLAGKAGVPMEVMRGVFETPFGCKLLHAMREAMGARFVQGGAVSSRTNEEEANAMLKDPQNAWYEAMYDPAHPRHKEANARYNRLMGFEG